MFLPDRRTLKFLKVKCNPTNKNCFWFQEQCLFLPDRRTLKFLKVKCNPTYKNCDLMLLWCGLHNNFLFS